MAQAPQFPSSPPPIDVPPPPPPPPIDVPPPPVFHYPHFDSIQAARDALWETGVGYDIVVRGQHGSNWMVHRWVLELEAPTFARMPEIAFAEHWNPFHGRRGAFVNFLKQEPSILGKLLEFLYRHDYDALCPHPYPPVLLTLLPVPFHIGMTIIGCTLGFPPALQKMAVYKVNQITYQFYQLINTTFRDRVFTPYEFRWVANGLDSAALTLYDQTNPVMVRYLAPMRAAFSRLVNIVMPWLFRQPGFSDAFFNDYHLHHAWVYPHMMDECTRHFAQGCLLPSWDDPPEGDGPVDWFAQRVPLEQMPRPPSAQPTVATDEQQNLENEGTETADATEDAKSDTTVKLHVEEPGSPTSNSTESVGKSDDTTSEEKGEEPEEPELDKEDPMGKGEASPKVKPKPKEEEESRTEAQSSPEPRPRQRSWAEIASYW